MLLGLVKCHPSALLGKVAIICALNALVSAQALARGADPGVVISRPSIHVPPVVVERPLGDLPTLMGRYQRVSGPKHICPPLTLDSESIEDDRLSLTPQISLRLRTGDQAPLVDETNPNCTELESAKRETLDGGAKVVLTSTLKVVCEGRIRTESKRRAWLTADSVILELEILGARSERCEFRRHR